MQSRIESGIEIFLNYLSGFIIAWCTYNYVVLPISWLRESPTLVTLLFTGVSIVRSYCWRRYFNGRLIRLLERIDD